MSSLERRLRDSESRCSDVERHAKDLEGRGGEADSRCKAAEVRRAACTVHDVAFKLEARASPACRLCLVQGWRLICGRDLAMYTAWVHNVHLP